MNTQKILSHLICVTDEMGNHLAVTRAVIDFRCGDVAQVDLTVLEDNKEQVINVSNVKVEIPDGMYQVRDISVRPTLGYYKSPDLKME